MNYIELLEVSSYLKFISKRTEENTVDEGHAEVKQSRSLKSTSKFKRDDNTVDDFKTL